MHPVLLGVVWVGVGIPPTFNEDSRDRPYLLHKRTVVGEVRLLDLAEAPARAADATHKDGAVVRRTGKVDRSDERATETVCPVDEVNGRGQGSWREAAPRHSRGMRLESGPNC